MKSSRLSSLLPIVALCASIVSLGSPSAAHAVPLPLESRLGGLAYYDPNLDVSWATNANLTGGSDNWFAAVAAAAALVIDGVSGWRLPSADVNGDGTVVNCIGGGVVGCADNEMGFLFWEEGITAVTSPGPFIELQSNFYWSGTEESGAPSDAWNFNFTATLGTQFSPDKTVGGFSWAVHSGDVGSMGASVPEPVTVALLGLGLGVLGLARKSRR